MLELQSTGRWFKSWPPRCRVQVVYIRASATKQYSLVPANGWLEDNHRSDVALAKRHRQCLGEGDEHPPTLSDVALAKRHRQCLGEGDEHPPTLS